MVRQHMVSRRASDACGELKRFMARPAFERGTGVHRVIARASCHIDNYNFSSAKGRIREQPIPPPGYEGDLIALGMKPGQDLGNPGSSGRQLERLQNPGSARWVKREYGGANLVIPSVVEDPTESLG